MAIIGESARWGDWFNNSVPYTKNDHWLPRKLDLLNNYFPFRSDTVLMQLREAGYFPSVDAPVFTNSGDTISAPINLGMSSNKGTIYYTLDGSNPRTSVTGAISTTARIYSATINIGSSTTVKARAKTSSEWSAITEATFIYDSSNAIKNLSAEQLACSSYPNPFSDQTQIQFTLPNAGNLQVDIYNVDGRLVHQLFKGNALGGTQKLFWSPSGNKNGVFICRINYLGQYYYLKLIKK